MHSYIPYFIWSFWWICEVDIISPLLLMRKMSFREGAMLGTRNLKFNLLITTFLFFLPPHSPFMKLIPWFHRPSSWLISGSFLLSHPPWVDSGESMFREWGGKSLWVPWFHPRTFFVMSASSLCECHTFPLVGPRRHFLPSNDGWTREDM